MAAVPSYAEICTRRAQPCTLRYLSDAAADEAMLPALLAQVEERSESGGYEQFSLLFSATEPAQPRQGLYAITFADATMWGDVFLVPIRRDDAQVVYEACFNRTPAAAAT